MWRFQNKTIHELIRDFEECGEYSSATPDVTRMGEPQRLLPMVYNLLKNRDAAVRSRAAEQLRQIVELSSGDMNPSQFSDLFAGVQTHLTLMIQGRVKDERLGAITAIDRLIDVSFNEASDTQTVRFANSLRNVFQVNLDVCDEEVLRLAARTLGHLARAGGAATSLTADFVDFEVTRALEWLREDVGRSAAPRRHAAVLILRELADNAPTLFYQKALMADAPGATSRGSLAARRGSAAPQAEARFFPAIGAALHDAKASVREDAAAALSACLALVAQRKSKQDWFVQIYEFAQLGFKQNKEATVHGSLIIVSELLDHTTSCDQFMRRGSGSFTALCRAVLSYKDHREKVSYLFFVFGPRMMTLLVRESCSHNACDSSRVVLLFPVPSSLTAHDVIPRCVPSSSCGAPSSALSLNWRASNERPSSRKCSLGGSSTS